MFDTARQGGGGLSFDIGRQGLGVSFSGGGVMSPALMAMNKVNMGQGGSQAMLNHLHAMSADSPATSAKLQQLQLQHPQLQHGRNMEPHSPLPAHHGSAVSSSSSLMNTARLTNGANTPTATAAHGNHSYPFQ